MLALRPGLASPGPNPNSSNPTLTPQPHSTRNPILTPTRNPTPTLTPTPTPNPQPPTPTPDQVLRLLALRQSSAHAAKAATALQAAALAPHDEARIYMLPSHNRSMLPSYHPYGGEVLRRTSERDAVELVISQVT